MSTWAGLDEAERCESAHNRAGLYLACCPVGAIGSNPTLSATLISPASHVTGLLSPLLSPELRRPVLSPKSRSLRPNNCLRSQIICGSSNQGFPTNVTAKLPGGNRNQMRQVPGTPSFFRGLYNTGEVSSLSTPLDRGNPAIVI
jgi:hypothetical protein